MGIRGLSQLLQELCGDKLKSVKLSTLSGWTIAIDGNLMVNQMLRLGSRIVNSRGEPIHHLQGSLWRLLSVLESNIKPVVVFDGKPPTLKGRVLDARRELRGDDAPKVTQIHYQQLQHMLRLMGVSVVSADGEAEAYAAKMKVDAVATDDLDALVFGAKCVIKGLSSDGDVMVIHRDDVLSCLGLTKSQFIDLCLLCGGDYLVNISGIGPKRALDLILQYKSMDKVIDAITNGDLKSKYQLPPDYPWVQARELYVNPIATGSVERSHKPNIPAVQEFLVGRGLDVTRVTKAMSRLHKISSSKKKSSDSSETSTTNTNNNTTTKSAPTNNNTTTKSTSTTTDADTKSTPAATKSSDDGAKSTSTKSTTKSTTKSKSRTLGTQS